jgi:hypothetical protein
LIELFEKYAGWKVLSHFLSNPAEAFYIKELARLLKLSPSTVLKAVEDFEREDLLRKEIRGLGHYYSLNLAHCAVPPLKRAYGLAFVLSANPVARLREADPTIISLALYGSYASGSFDDRSDIDLLAITHADKMKLVPPVMAIEGFLGKEVNISAFRLSEWKSLSDEGDAFYRSVMGNHVTLYGSDLI